ncbi:hypothetical protein [Methylobacterium variabile]|uniref:hypothetical protein n=1 Tax=Methylobacterium variabile TaxID=298794 RepID=UPI0012EDD68E|nr:hypothetical protein [Methylobacterium variabile]
MLRGIRVSLGLEYHHEELLLATLAGEEPNGDYRAPPPRRVCHRGASEICALPIRCCTILAATVTPRLVGAAAPR